MTTDGGEGMSDHEDPIDEAGEEHPLGSVLAVTDTPLPIDVREIEADPIPEGMICLGTFIGGTLVARCVLPTEALEQIATYGLFTEPRQLVLAAREEDPGLRCELYALVPLPRQGSAPREKPADEPWLAAANAQGYERAIAADADDGDDPDGSPDGGPMQAAVLLGQIVRFARDRKYPDSLPYEAADVLSRIVSGRVVTVVDKVLEDLLGPGPAGL